MLCGLSEGFSRSLMVHGVQTLKSFISRNLLRRSPLHMWRKRARQYGERAALNIGHSANEVERVTQGQKNILFPLLVQQLRGDEKLLLDLGCGPGRFTPDLAEIIHGKAIGVDPITDFIEMAAQTGNVEYRRMKPGAIPMPTASIDVVWICLVLGGLTQKRVLRKTLSEVKRVLAPEGLVMLIENTSAKKDGDYWKFRSVSTYQSFFDFVDLKHLSDYHDLGERISIMAGRKHS